MPAIITISKFVINRYQGATYLVNVSPYHDYLERYQKVAITVNADHPNHEPTKHVVTHAKKIKNDTMNHSFTSCSS